MATDKLDVGFKPYETISITEVIIVSTSWAVKSNYRSVIPQSLGFLAARGNIWNQCPLESN